MEENLQSKSNSLSKKIDQSIRRTGFDDNFIRATLFHLKKIEDAYLEKQTLSKMELCEVLLSNLFLDKMDLYPTKRFACRVDENSNWPVPLLPSEVFGEVKLPDKFRKQAFYKCLRLSDVLDCRVSVILPTGYQLRVIHKYGSTRILDDLNITVLMHHIPQKELLPSELIRVAVSEIHCVNKEVTVYVTLNMNKRLKKKVKLGKISAADLPTYVLDPPDPDVYPTYTDYLNSMPGFHNPLLLNNIISEFGIDINVMHSFLPSFHGLQYPEELTGQPLLMESKSEQIKKYLNEAIQELEMGDYPNALASVEMVLELNPGVSQAYEIRGRIYTAIEGHRFTRKSLANFDVAYCLDQNNEYAKNELSKCLFYVANGCYKRKQYKAAIQIAENALKVNEKNLDAVAFIKYAKRKYPEIFIDLESESIPVLEAKK